MIYFLGYIKATKGVESYMKIIIDEKAKKYLKDNKQSVFTIEVRGCSSWSGTVFKPLASVGKPYNTENFDLKKSRWFWCIYHEKYKSCKWYYYC